GGLDRGILPVPAKQLVYPVFMSLFRLNGFLPASLLIAILVCFTQGASEAYGQITLLDRGIWPAPIPPGAVSDIRIVDHYAYASVYESNLKGDYPSGFIVFDVAEPAKPIVVTNVPGNATGIEVVGNFLYAAATNMIRIFDIKNRAEPVQIGTFL